MMTITVLERTNLAHTPFGGGNPVMHVELDGVGYTVLRQGGIGLWAWAKRGKLNRAQAAAFDKLCDAAWADKTGVSFTSEAC